MDKLYTPWRSEYVGSHDKPDECVFCTMFQQTDDEQNLILRRFTNIVAILNKFPYNAGHIMLLPKIHVASIDELDSATRLELMDITNESIKILQKTLKCDAINAGLNLGKAAGGSQPGHLHLHILPRWTGDTNFLATLADTKIISFNLREVCAKLRPEFEKIQT
jgi:ATP adenylyltransferase